MLTFDTAVIPRCCNELLAELNRRYPLKFPDPFLIEVQRYKVVVGQVWGLRRSEESFGFCSRNLAS